MAVEVADPRSPAEEDAHALLNAIVAVLHESLETLRRDPGTVQLAEIVQRFYFDGQTWEQVASSLGISRETAKRRCKTARSCLRHLLTDEFADDGL